MRSNTFQLIQLWVKMLNKITRELLEKVPKECEHCESIRINFWEELEDKLVFRCIDCGTYYPIPIDLRNLRIDYSF